MLVNGLEEGAGAGTRGGGLVASHLAVRRKINVYLLYRAIWGAGELNKVINKYKINGIKIQKYHFVKGWGWGGAQHHHKLFTVIFKSAPRRQLFAGEFKLNRAETSMHALFRMKLEHAKSSSIDACCGSVRRLGAGPFICRRLNIYRARRGVE